MFKHLGLSFNPASLAKLKSKASIWFTLLAAMTVALASAAIIYHHNQIVERSNTTRYLLTQTKERISNLNALEWEGIANAKLNDEWLESLDVNYQSTDIILVKLHQVNRQQGGFERFFELYSCYKRSINYAVNLLEKGKADEAREHDEEVIDKIYEDLYAEVANLEAPIQI